MDLGLLIPNNAQNRIITSTDFQSSRFEETTINNTGPFCIAARICAQRCKTLFSD